MTRRAQQALVALICLTAYVALSYGAVVYMHLSQHGGLHTPGLRDCAALCQDNPDPVGCAKEFCP